MDLRKQPDAASQNERLSRGETHGRVVKKTAHESGIEAPKVAASKDKPEYAVQSARSGKRAAHKRSALKKG